MNIFLPEILRSRPLNKYHHGIWCHVFCIHNLFHRDEINRELCGTGIIEAVNRDVKGITQEFTKTVVPFITKHADMFP